MSSVLWRFSVLSKNWAKRQSIRPVLQRMKKERPISFIFGLTRHRVSGGTEDDRLIAERSGFQAANHRDDFAFQSTGCEPG
ncbi:hypothetical protein [Mesorhizobium sp. M7A.F.Ca.US.014.04.1.1]|uniref:hypothetical protein n=1 Tax=Mesorhizobium sp. M7A.F.Ca.US.014.04.1.1 TaxID=2496744 RepID=UPI0007A94ED8|nr:hypothetical protein [Mesorhizobium sp. M7A.F.Ca.US.014.04.1.1]AMX97862.1 hypothetical protein A4R28_32240 [Mesorhizobium ciceri]